MSEPSKRDRVPQVLLEQLALGELSEARVAALREEFGEATLATLLADLETSSEELRQRLPDAAVFARRVAARRAKPARAGVATWAWAVPALAAAVLLGVWNAELPSSDQGSERAVHMPASERVKGLEPRLHVYRKRGGEVERLGSDSLARPGDVVQLGYVAAGLPYGTIVSLDGRGVVTLHFPAEGREAAVLEPDGEDLLPDAYELDDAPAYERFFLIASATRFDVTRVLDAARALAQRPQDAPTDRLDLDDTYRQVGFLLKKEEH